MSDDVELPGEPSSQGSLQNVARIGGPLLAVAIYFALTFEPSLTHPARAVAATAALMAVWWMTEALPLAATALLPLVLFPLLNVYPAETDPERTAALKKVAAPFADPTIFLYLGGFFLAASVEKWGLHRRLALGTLRMVGTQPNRILAGFLGATAFLSLWISNTATTVMMLPIVMSIVRLAEGEDEAATEHHRDDVRRFGMSLLLAVAYAASIGGCGTLIGTPTNTFFAGFARDHGLKIGFAAWMTFAVPVAIVYLVLAWFLFAKILFPVRMENIAGGREFIDRESAHLGPMSQAEMSVVTVFLAAVIGWLGREPLGYFLPDLLPYLKRLDDTTIAVAAGLMLFLIPVDARRGVFLLDWKSASRAPWEALLMFGGGLSLSEAIKSTDLAGYLGRQLQFLEVLPMPLIVCVLVLGIIFFSELTSNVATIATILPIVYQVALDLKVDPLLIMVPCALASSYAFMLPAGTPPNAIVYGTGRVPLPAMIRAGFVLNCAGGILIPLATYTLGRWLLGIRV